jgi:hypothetical protein
MYSIRMGWNEYKIKINKKSGHLTLSILSIAGGGGGEGNHPQSKRRWSDDTPDTGTVSLIIIPMFSSICSPSAGELKYGSTVA